MKVFNYHPRTKEYISMEEAFLDPLAARNLGQERYLIPAHATSVEVPEAKEGYARVWDHNSWIYVEDHRGKRVWKSCTEYLDIRELGAVPEGYTMERPEKPLTAEDYDALMESHITKTRFERGYTTREPSEYRGSSVARWAQDAEDYIKFRDECMMYGLTVQNDYAAGKSVPSLEEFAANLPVCVWTFRE